MDSLSWAVVVSQQTEVEVAAWHPAGCCFLLILLLSLSLSTHSCVLKLQQRGLRMPRKAWLTWQSMLYYLWKKVLTEDGHYAISLRKRLTFSDPLC